RSEAGNRLEEGGGVLAALALPGRREALAGRGGDEAADDALEDLLSGQVPDLSGRDHLGDVALDSLVTGGAGGRTLGVAPLEADGLDAEVLGALVPAAGAGEEVDVDHASFLSMMLRMSVRT